MTSTSHINQVSLAFAKSEFPKTKIITSQQGSEFIKQFYHDDIYIYESFYLLLLNTGGYTIGYTKISQGGITGTVADIRLIAKIALESLSTKVILAHNHPSGNLTPSEADRKLTERIQQALRMFDIEVLDHLILTGDSYFSFRDEGLM